MQKVRRFYNSLLTIKRSNINLSIKIGTIIFATMVFFFNDLAIIFTDALNNEEISYILLVPFIFAYMIYRKRKMLRVVMPDDIKEQPKKLKYVAPIAGILLFTTAILLYWHGTYTFTPLEYHLVSMPLFAAGLILLFFNLQTLRETIFPIIFLFFLAPPPTEILYTVGATLSSLSSEVSNALIGLAGIPSTLTNEYASPMIIITRANGAQLNFTVDVACSGIYSLLGFLMFAVLLAYIIRDRPWKKITLILTGILIVYLLNVVRITTILVMGYQFGENIALQAFHLLGGWLLIFLGTLLLLFTGEKILKTRFFDTKKKECKQCAINNQKQDFCFTCGRLLKHKGIANRRSDILKVASTIAVVVIFLSIQAPVFAMTHGPADILVNTPSGQTANTEILPSTSGYLVEFAYRDTAFEEYAHQDLSVAYIYSPRQASLDTIWVTLEISSSRSSLHRWETCLVNYPLSQGWKPTVVQLELEDIQLSDNPLIIGRFFVFENTTSNDIESVLYWYESATFNTESASEQKTMKISVIGYPYNLEDLATFKNQQLQVAKSIIEYWEPVKLWSTITMVISKNGGYLAITTTLVLIALVIYYSVERVKQQKINRSVYNKLSKLNREIVDAIKASRKTDMNTLNAISSAYKEATDQEMSKEKLVEKLEELEKERIIESQIRNNKDVPTRTWKA